MIKNNRLCIAKKLAQCEEFKRIYVSPDEPLDVRRQATLERLKKGAEREREKQLTSLMVYFSSIMKQFSH